VGIGLLNLLLVSPFLAFLVGELYGLAATLAVGVVLLGASPGGTTANLLTHLARGDVALSVSMTAVSSVASVITVPLFLSLGADHFGARTSATRSRCRGSRCASSSSRSCPC
jgi:BASS family bile acid:Na+ symporter